MTKTRPTVGDTAWFVEWCYELAFDQGGDVDRDNCKEHRRRFATKEEAAAFAREIWPTTTDKLGIVTYWQADFVAYDEEDAARYPHVGYWEPRGEYDEIYDGEE
jgi:hypothetical protein